VRFVLLVGLLGGTLAPGGVAGATPSATPVAAPPEQAHASALQALAQARDFSASDQHQNAIRAYLRAFELEPSLASSYGGELGHQYNWNDEPQKAIPWFKTRLATAPGSVGARIGYARALSWVDRNQEAWQEYRRVLIGHPDSKEARLGEAQTLSWMGHNRQAARQYQKFLDDHPESKEARLGLAQSWAWTDELQLALSALDPMREDPDAQALRQRILAARHPELVARSRLTKDSDELKILSNELSYENTTPRWQDLQLALLQGRFWQEGQPDIDELGLRVGGAMRPSPTTQAHLYLTPMSFSSDSAVVNGPPDKVDFFLLSWDAWFTWWANYRWRLDFSTGRSFIDTPGALSEEITVTSFAASADWHLRPNLIWSAVLRYGDYSDGNGRSYLSSHLDYSYGRSWRLTLTPSLTTFRFSKISDRGYWNPSDFFNARASARLEKDFDPRVSAAVEIGLGHEWADDDDYGVFNGSAELAWRISQRWRLELSGGSSDSKLSSSGGYNRKFAAIALHYKF
jgi:Flp pilus assembly protein TadD